MSEDFPWSKSIFINNPGLCVSKDSDVELFKPYKIKDLVLKNRIVFPSICQYSSKDGFMNAFHLIHYGRFALGGVGLVFVEATSVVPDGRITPFDLGLWKDEQIDEMKKLVDICHSHGTAVGIQIAHAGRKACTSPKWLYGDCRSLKSEFPDWNIVGTSSIAYDEYHNIPKGLSEDEIQKLCKSFADAAARADKAGFDVLEIYASHGYLLSTFISAYSNQRTDDYGGSFEKRIRFLIEVVDEVTKVWPKHKPLFIKLSCDELVEGGWRIEDTIKLVKVLKEHGVDMIHCSSGGVFSKQVLPPLEEGYQVKYSDAVKNEGGVPSIAIGHISTPSYAESILKEGKADLVSIGKGMLKNSNWVYDAAEALGVDLLKPIQYDLEEGHLKEI